MMIYDHTVCDSPPSLGNGSYETISSLYDGMLIESDKIRYFCGEDYDLAGNSELTCISNGSWNGEMGSCNRGN